MTRNGALPRTPWRVGALARHSGVTVRALHHYEAVGLLQPTQRSAAGHRLYGDADLARLQQIRSLRYLGLSLERIRVVLDAAPDLAADVIASHVDRLREQIALQQQLVSRLDVIRARLLAGEAASLAELVSAMEVMAMVESKFSEDELAFLRRRRDEVGDARIKEVEAEWPALMDEVRAAIAGGISPDSDRGRELAARWFGLVREFTGDHPGVSGSLANSYKDDPTQGGLMPGDLPELFAWIAAVRESTA